MFAILEQSMSVCTCVEHKCNESRLEDGTPGRVINNSSTLRRHRRDEEDRLRIQATRNMLQGAAARKDEILQREQESLITRFQQLSVHQKRSERDPIDSPSRSQEAVDAIGQVKDRLNGLLKQAPRRSSFSGPRARYSVDQTCHELRQCKLEIDRLHKEFQAVLKSRHLRSLSSLALRDEVLHDFQEAFSFLKAEKRYWTKIKNSPDVETEDNTPKLPPSRIVTTGK
ncbi:hypothetical protein V5O48_005653 [Marasmius crinis-equi]|uniref:Uncharacterized protein n=1 Tax=Marasmius crinis-equi TaxID=585013 RepID=A0ABR3FLV7_9AGAR